MTEPEHCKRCGAELPELPPTNAFRYIATMRRETIQHYLEFTHWRFSGNVNADATSITLSLCDACAIDVLLYAQGEETDNENAGE